MQMQPANITPVIQHNVGRVVALALRSHAGTRHS